MIIEAILFDLDDTLLDRDRALFKFIELFQFKYKHLMNNEYTLELKDIFAKLDCKGYKPRAEMFRELQDGVLWNSAPDIQEQIDFWNSEFPKCAEPMDDLYKVLNYFANKNVKMGIITNGGINMQNEKIDKLDIRKYMQTIIISDQVGIRKPDPQIFHTALAEIGVKSERAIFIGDNPSTDIRGAVDAGLVSVWFSAGKIWTIEEYMPSVTVKSLSELMKL